MTNGLRCSQWFWSC